MHGRMHNNIAAIRRHRRMTQQQLGTMIGKKRHTIAEYELGVIDIPLSVLYDIARALEVSVTALIHDGPATAIPRQPAKRGRPRKDEVSA